MKENILRCSPWPGASLPLLSGIVATLFAAGAMAGHLRLEFSAKTTGIVLHGQDAAQQVLATVTRPGEKIQRDLSREVTWSVAPDGLARVDRGGRVTPVSDGEGNLTATWADGSSASLPLKVEAAATPTPIHFANQIVPIFTKNGCNGGGCHGKSAGQNGFRLSLLGFEPGEDYEHLVKEARGRRLFPAAPERSLLLTKGYHRGEPYGRSPQDHADFLTWVSLEEIAQRVARRRKVAVVVVDDDAEATEEESAPDDTVPPDATAPPSLPVSAARAPCTQAPPSQRS